MEEKVVQYRDRPFFTKSTQDRRLSQCFARVVGRSLPSEVNLLEDIEFL